ncbi:unnamed protein product [Ceutorhynchus assimilis]|uniref:PAT complex subunit CCDC47 n=1 Tax=Ceutorhynchus assimilis TaxID=467358 RepID=A0A9N9MRF1_9CUCU|nr:unnamed protein product [Ceutorhynchus assimilis]
MQILKFLSIFLLLHCALGNFAGENEFAEFEDFEDSEQNFVEENEQVQEDPAANQFIPVNGENLNEEALIEEESDEEEVDIEVDSEFEHFQDTDEFEGFEEKEEKPLTEPKITIAKVPLNLIHNWDSYYLEILMIAIMVAYFINFAMGRSKNSKIASTWFELNKQLLEENFAMVGDDGSKERNENVNLVKESENVYTLWCSGRTCCEGMLVELRLIKRHDLVALIANLMKPSVDQVHITVRMSKEDMDNFVFAAAIKKTALQITKDLQDISIYSPERKAGEKFNLPASFQVMSEIGEATSAMLDSKIIAILNKYPEYVDYIHFSDQFSGMKLTDDINPNPNKMPDVEKVLRFGFNLQTKGVPLEETLTRLKPLMSMVFYCMDKVKRYRLSREGKLKADKNRQKVEEAFLKSTHQARAEAAAAKREEKKRQEKEKILAEEDPEKQRRWEIKEEKRQAKKRAPRMKQLKVKAL